MSSSFFADLDEPKYTKSKSSFFDDLDEEPSSFRSAISAPFKGAIKELSGLNPFSAPGPVPRQLQERLLEEQLPIRPEHEYLERAGKLATLAALGPESIPAKIAETVGGTIAGELAESGGLGTTGQSISEAVGMGIPGLIKGAAKKGAQLIKGTVEKTPSGLEKISATEAKFPGLAKVSKERQEKVIKDLDKQAAALTKKSVEKHVPVAKEIERGVDFESNFSKGFQDLRSSAKQANPEIDITPISEFLSTTSDKFRGIPKPSSDLLKIKNEVKAFQNRPQFYLNNLLKI
jgi:hypothetical protein